MTDERLLILLRNEPENGMRKLTQQYGGLVSTVIRGRLFKPAFSERDIEECASDVFSDFYLMLPGFDESCGSVKALLAVLARRRAADVLRRYYRNGENLSLQEEDAAGSLFIETELEERELREKLVKCINGLAQPDREIIIRKYYLGQPSKEIAKALSMTVSNVDTRAHRALKRLRDELESEI